MIAAEEGRAEDFPRTFHVSYFPPSKHWLSHDISFCMTKKASVMDGHFMYICVLYMCVCVRFIIIVLYVHQNVNIICSSFWENEPIYRDLGIAMLNLLTHYSGLVYRR